MPLVRDKLTLCQCETIYASGSCLVYIVARTEPVRERLDVGLPGQACKLFAAVLPSARAFLCHAVAHSANWTASMREQLVLVMAQAMQCPWNLLDTAITSLAEYLAGSGVFQEARRLFRGRCQHRAAVVGGV